MSDINVIYKDLKELVPYKNNPRKNDEAAPLVAASIKQFGFKAPIVVDKNNVIVCGHTRYKAVEMVIALCDTPFLYIAKRIHRPEAD